jgi:Tfp pilus assembly protein PilO
MIAILVTMVVLLGVFFTMAVDYPTRKQARRLAKSRAILEAQMEAVSPKDGNTASDAAIIDAMAFDFNFFKRRDLPPQRGIPELLEQINRMGNKMNLQFVAVKPLEEEKTPEYRRYPFLIEMKAAYPELVNFVHRIENGLHLSLRDLRIETEKKTSSTHRLWFTLNILELEDHAELNPGEPKNAQLSLPMDVDRLTVRRDPFALRDSKKPVELPEIPKVAKAAPKRPKRPKLVLMGVMDIAGSRRAIINNEVLKQGEIIHGQRIQEIADDHVVMEGGDRSYALYLKASTPLERREVQQ